MNDGDFKKTKKEVLDNLTRIIEGSTLGFNERQEKLSNKLFTAATTYITLMLAFATNVRNAFDDKSWIILASIFFFSFSLIPWIIDKILGSNLYSKTLKTADILFDHTNKEIFDSKSLISLNKLAVNLLSDKRSSMAPIILQTIFFVFGVLFSIIAITIILL